MIPPIPQNTPYARLERHLDVSAFGSELLTIGDIDADGRQEFVFTQSTGMLAADLFKPGAGGAYGDAYTTAADQALDCVTAVDLDGRVLWQRGEPWREAIPFRQHGGHNMMLVEDIDGDGKLELVRQRGDRLAILDGKTGLPRHETRLDSDGYSALLTARFTRDGSRHILVYPCSDGLAGHPYCSPMIAYDAQLRQAWGRRDFLHAGHTPVAYDVDGDGLDEILAGFQCIDATGAIRWTLPLSGAAGHPDRCTVADVDGDGVPEQVLACEDYGLLVTTLTGDVRWQFPARHCGEACVGKFYTDIPGLQILGNDETWRLRDADSRAPASYLLDGRGAPIWTSDYDRYAIPIDWPTTLGPQAMLAKPHLANPDDARPFVMDGAGAVLAQFDLPLRQPQYVEYDLPHQRPAWGDWGDYYSSACVDLDGTGPRIVIWSRREVWVFALGV